MLCVCISETVCDTPVDRVHRGSRPHPTHTGERISLSSAIGNTLRSGGQGLIRSQKGQVTPDRPLRIVGTHHKTGTMLLSMLLRYVVEGKEGGATNQNPL